MARNGNAPPIPPESTDRWLDAEDTAELLGVSVDLIRRDTVHGNLGLPRYQLGPKTVRYRLSEVLAWAESRRVVPANGRSGKERQLDEGATVG